MSRQLPDRRAGEPSDPLQPHPPSGRERPSWLPWVALVIVAAVGGGLVWYVSPSETRPQPVQSSPTTSSSTGASATLAPGVPATTYAAFAALPPAQQQATMQQAMAHYSAVLYEAYRTLNPGLLPQIASGPELQVLQQNLAAAVQADRPGTGTSSFTILHITMSPQPFTFVSVDAQGTDVDQYLDPRTLLPIGTPNTTTTRSSYSFVIDAGVWKVQNDIQEQPTS
jgi:hypothetical protein